MNPLRIAPSILAADTLQLGLEIERVIQAGCDLLHVDIMDGHFVPNLSMGPSTVAALKRISTVPLDVHLMIRNPDAFIEPFIDAGADILTVHVEAAPHLHRTLQRIRDLGRKPGVSLNPATPPESLYWVLDEVDVVLVMAVNPGFGGQRFIPSALSKIRKLQEHKIAGCFKYDIEVDGGIVVQNAADVIAAGATILVSGTGIFGTEDYRDTLCRMRQSISK